MRRAVVPEVRTNISYISIRHAKSVVTRKVIYDPLHSRSAILARSGDHSTTIIGHWSTFENGRARILISRRAPVDRCKINQTLEPLHWGRARLRLELTTTAISPVEARLRALLLEKSALARFTTLLPLPLHIKYFYTN